MLLTAITFLSCLTAAIALVWGLSLALKVKSLKEAHADAEARHRELLEQTEHGSALRRKIEAQLLEKQDRLDKLAHHDQLTGLPNRLFLAAHLPDAMEEARRRKLPLAVLFIDLDRFKHVNDTFGHEVGDKLLQTVAQRIKDAVRAEDVVVRMGGDEFVVILTAVKVTQVNETAARITGTLNAPIVIDGKPSLVNGAPRRTRPVPGASAVTEARRARGEDRGEDPQLRAQLPPRRRSDGSAREGARRLASSIDEEWLRLAVHARRARFSVLTAPSSASTCATLDAAARAQTGRDRRGIARRR